MENDLNKNANKINTICIYNFVFNTKYITQQFFLNYFAY